MEKRTINPFSAFWMIPKAARKNITDSMLLDSGTEVISAKVDGYDIFVRVCGDVRVIFEDTVSFPGRTARTFPYPRSLARPPRRGRHE